MAKSIITNNYDSKFCLAFTSISRSFLFSYTDDEIYQSLVNNTYKDTSVFKLFKSCLLYTSPYVSKGSFYLMDKVTNREIKDFEIHEVYLENYQGIRYNGDNKEEAYLSLIHI